MRIFKKYRDKLTRSLWIRIISSQRKEHRESLKSYPYLKPFRTAVYEYTLVDGVITFTARPKVKGAAKWCISAAISNRLSH